MALKIELRASLMAAVTQSMTSLTKKMVLPTKSGNPIIESRWVRAHSLKASMILSVSGLLPVNISCAMVCQTSGQACSPLVMSSTQLPM